MAKSTDIVCSRCRRVIPVGDPYAIVTRHTISLIVHRRVPSTCWSPDDVTTEHGVIEPETHKKTEDRDE